jgi:cytochrome c oxidase assembly protein subunit 11
VSVASAALAQQTKENTRLLRKLFVIALAMFGFGFALVPLYEKICQVSGIRNLLRPDHVVAKNTQVDTSRKIAIDFDSNIRGLPWTFRPLEPTTDLHPGELKQVEYEIRNNENRTITGQAIPSYGPPHAAQYFKKLQCFCFEQQTLGPGESRRMPIVFLVDPGLPKDVRAITLSFTFFEVVGRNKKDGT